ncbi:RING-H2 finger protein ATL72 [Apostasia shenzhenica]|uniref:RING-H2 finger protein ATL72 n=1 Tax=Apostasia shenzhenica TaxID=1088818 RepID=A0A2I0AQ79_9ASPA|nr:RING-H2 finger protein ATL72 [Apostasia shenzhenica]
MRRLLGTPAEAPPPNRLSQPFAGSGETNFDTNMVIILAALLCALICALGLNSIVRCALRCGRRLAFETPEAAAARLAATGLKKRALRRIPVAVYGAGVNIPATDCPICLGEFADGEKVRVLPRCNHGFHVRCIDTWLASHSSCPTCRHSLLDRAAAAGEAAAVAGSAGAVTPPAAVQVS